MTEGWKHSVAALQQRACLTPRPLTSTTPVIGGVIAWFRNTWNSVSTRWYVAPLVQQQNEFNQGVVSELYTLKEELHTLIIAQQEMRELLDEISSRLIASDRDVVAVTHDLGKVTYTVIRLDETIKRLDDALSG